MPRICPKCGTLQPDGPRCLNCGAKFDAVIETSQGTRVTKRQVRDYALYIMGIIAITMVFFGAIVVACMVIAR